ncbi:hypothetical protein [Glaciimonas sp. PCH181]|uniref:hypothetical protein n=1 Tax=Glaciimonas sp. PCH181 TaxID=2133943 RepID=UPI000D36D1A2|nr:hypothetical protein [Glaciimonas sp. PCH181]PUA17284.1 hypothetical protein C7W93_15250 [Glaciimonas sp. PCH181]
MLRSQSTTQLSETDGASASAAAEEKMTEEINLLQLHLVREDKDQSKALPDEFYRDPAQHVRFAKERCGGCKYERIIIAGKDIGIGVCMKKNKDGSKRLYGTRCSDFREVGTK